jgi:hypothetical protein
VVHAVTDASELDALKVAYSQAFGRWTEVHRERGAIARWVANAEVWNAVRRPSKAPRPVVTRPARARQLCRQ